MCVCVCVFVGGEHIISLSRALLGAPMGPKGSRWRAAFFVGPDPSAPPPIRPPLGSMAPSGSLWITYDRSGPLCAPSGPMGPSYPHPGLQDPNFGTRAVLFRGLTTVLCLSICLSTRRPVCLYVCLSVCLSAYLPGSQPVCLYECLLV